MKTEKQYIKYVRQQSQIKVDVNMAPEQQPAIAADLIIRSAIERNVSTDAVLEEVKNYIEKEKELCFQKQIT